MELVNHQRGRESGQRVGGGLTRGLFWAGAASKILLLGWSNTTAVRSICAGLTVAPIAVEPEASATSRPAAATSTAEPAETFKRETGGEGEITSGDHSNKELEGGPAAEAGGVGVETEEEASAATPGRSREPRKSGGSLGHRRTGSGIFRHLVEKVQTPARTRRRRRAAAAAAAAAAADAAAVADAAVVADADADSNTYRADRPPAAGSEKGTTTTVATTVEKEEFDEDEVAEALAKAEAGDKEGGGMVVSRGIVMENAEISGRDDVLRVEGRLHGKMDVRRLEVEVGATVKGIVKVQTACVKGTFDGTMECKEFLIVRKGARFCGEVSYRHLRVEPGASLEARMHHVCPTTTAVPPAATVTMPTAEEVASPPAGGDGGAATVTMPTAEEAASPPADGDGGNAESDAPPAPASAPTAGPAAAPATGESEGREEGTGESGADKAPGPIALGAAGNSPPAATTTVEGVSAAVPPSTLPAATTPAEDASAAAPPSTTPGAKSAADAATVAPSSPAAVAATTSTINHQKPHQHQKMPWMPSVPTTTAAEVPAAWGVMMAAMAAGGMLPSKEQKQEGAAACATGKKQQPWTWSAVRAARARATAAEAEAGGGDFLVGRPRAARVRRTAAAAAAAAITSASHSKSTAAAGVDSYDGSLHQEDDDEKEGEATTAPGGSARRGRAWASKEVTATIPTEIAASPRPVGLLRRHGAASNPSPTCASTKENSNSAVEVDPAVLATLPPVPAALDAAVTAMEAAKNRCVEDAAGISVAGEGVMIMDVGEGISSCGSDMVAPVVREVGASADSGGGVGKGAATSAVGLSEISAATDSPVVASSTTSNDKNNSGSSRRFCWNTPPPTCRLPAPEKAALVEEGKRALLAVRKEKRERERMMALAPAATLEATERDGCEKSETSLLSSPMTTPARSRDRCQAHSPNRPRPRSPDRPKPRSPDRSQPRSPDRFQPHSPGRFQPHSPGRFQPRSPDHSQSRIPMWASPWSPARSPGRSPGRPRRNLTRAPSTQQAATDNKEGGKKTKTVEKPPPLTLHEKAAAATVPWAAVGAEAGGGNKAKPVSKLSEAKAFLLGLVSAAPQQQQQLQGSSGVTGDDIGDDRTDPSGVGHADNDGNDVSGRGRSRGRSKTRDAKVKVFEASTQEASVGGGGMLHLIRGRWARDKGRSLRRARSLDKPTKAPRKRKGGIVADEPCDPASSAMVTISATRCPGPGEMGKNEGENERLVVSVPFEEEGGSEGGGVGEGGGSACVASSPVRAPVRAPLTRQARFRRSTSMPDSVSALVRTGADADAGGGFETGDGGKALPGGDGVKASPGEARPTSDKHGGFASKACSTALGGVAEVGGGEVVTVTRRARGWRRMVTGPED